MVEYLRVGPWYRSNVTAHTLQGLVDGGQLMPNTDSSRPAWIVLPAHHQESQPPEGYMVSFIHLHERRFNAPASKFMRGLCYHYGVELHNFAPNSISQAATFVGICEGSWASPSHGTCSSTSSEVSSSRPAGARASVGPFAPAGSRSRCGTGDSACARLAT
jgi:hypothetical protein